MDYFPHLVVLVLYAFCASWLHSLLCGLAFYVCRQPTLNEYELVAQQGLNNLGCPIIYLYLERKHMDSCISLEY